MTRSGWLPRRASLWRRVAFDTSMTKGARAALLALMWVTIVAGLVATDFWCIQFTRVPVVIQIARTSVTISVDGQALEAPLTTLPNSITPVSGASGPREYQVDGTDATNNLTETPASDQALNGNPYVRFLNWMRSSNLYSEWVNLRETDASGTAMLSRDSVVSGVGYDLHAADGATISIDLERPEAPATLTLSGSTGPLAVLTVDRNDRLLSLDAYSAGGTVQTYRAPYFPTCPLPFLAEIVDTLIRVLLWATLLVGMDVMLALCLAWLWQTLSGKAPLAAGVNGTGAPSERINHRQRMAEWLTGYQLWRVKRTASLWQPLSSRTRAVIASVGWCHIVAGCALLGSLAAEIVVALVQFQGEPHILDASAYYFQAKVFASGHLSVPAPADLAAFQGPFMVVWNHRWFAQYPPATSALLAIGILVHAPWLVEPVLGTAALAGVYAIGCQLYDRRTALVALGLLILSPFYVYQAASYLSHTVALAAEVGFFAALLWFARSHRAVALGLAGASLGVMFAARELDAVLVGIIATGWVAAVERQRLLGDWRRVLLGAAVGAAALGCGLALYLAYNAAQTGNPLLLPRTLFSPADHFGFGTGVGFYGQHTLAAGFVNLDQELTSLLIDLYGWPFYVTLALIPLAFIRKDAGRTWDGLMLTLAGVLVLAQVGYFYHGIYLGPRYFFSALPAFALLTARGLRALVASGRAVLARLGGTAMPVRRAWSARAAAALLLAGVMACGLVFYWPRQIALYTDYSGLPATIPLDVSEVYGARLTNALVITDSWYVYNYVLWPLNAPRLNSGTLYAYAATADDISRLRSEFPGRHIYLLITDSRGAVQFVPVP